MLLWMRIMQDIIQRRIIFLPWFGVHIARRNAGSLFKPELISRTKVLLHAKVFGRKMCKQSYFILPNTNVIISMRTGQSICHTPRGCQWWHVTNSVLCMRHVSVTIVHTVTKGFPKCMVRMYHAFGITCHDYTNRTTPRGRDSCTPGYPLRQQFPGWPYCEKDKYYLTWVKVQSVSRGALGSRLGQG